MDVPLLTPAPLNFAKIWGWSPHVPNVRFPAPVLPRSGKLGEHWFYYNLFTYKKQIMLKDRSSTLLVTIVSNKEIYSHVTHAYSINRGICHSSHALLI